MNGYVMNASTMWMHAMKRAIGPGQKITLDELFTDYGVKHDLKEGPEFVEWLRNVKLKDREKWKIVLEDYEKKEPKVEEAEEKPPATEKKQNLSPRHMSVDDVVGLSVRQAREVLPNVTDLNLLKYAMQEANQLSGKDSLCKIIRKRIRDLQIAR